jgi:hypothetical protein
LLTFWLLRVVVVVLVFTAAVALGVIGLLLELQAAELALNPR